MNKTSTAVYILIALTVVVLAILMAKPKIEMNGQTGYIKLLNYKKA